MNWWITELSLLEFWRQARNGGSGQNGGLGQHMIVQPYFWWITQKCIKAAILAPRLEGQASGPKNGGLAQHMIVKPDMSVALRLCASWCKRWSDVAYHHNGSKWIVFTGRLTARLKLAVITIQVSNEIHIPAKINELRKKCMKSAILALGPA